MKDTAFALALLALLPQSPAQSSAATAAEPRGFLQRSLHDDRGDHRYVVFVPPDYDARRSWPLLVFLNGAGECGTDGWSQVSVGLGPAIMADVENWPFLVLFAQKPDKASAWEDHDAMVMAMLDAVRADYRADDKRLFLTGLSQGGHGTWVLGARHKDLWAAIAPVCGYGDGATLAGDLAGMPIWCFHGDADKAVSVEQSKAITAAIVEQGGHPTLTIYPGVGHDSWVRAYRGEPLAAWLLVARSEPVLARYLAEPGAMASASIHAAAGPLLNGQEVGELTLDGDAATWQRTRSPGSESSVIPVPKEGRLRGEAGRRFVAAQLARLAVRGGFDHERTPTPHPLPTHEDLSRVVWQIDIAVDGRHGAWSYRRDSTVDEGIDAARGLLQAISGLAR